MQTDETHHEAHAETLRREIFAKMSPLQKWEEVCRLRAIAWDMKAAAIRTRYPAWTPADADAGDPWHHWAFKNRKRVELAFDLSVWVAPPEYVIVRKLEYFRDGGSDKHLQDIRNMP